jgi:hypothetical protein
MRFFPKQYQLISYYNGDKLCLLERGKLILRIQLTRTAKRGLNFSGGVVVYLSSLLSYAVWTCKYFKR